jgi:hypothetical protein
MRQKIHELEAVIRGSGVRDEYNAEERRAGALKKILKQLEEETEIAQMDPKKGDKGVRQVLKNQEIDEIIKEKFNEEQNQTLSDFKNLIYESEKRKKQQQQQ